MMWGPFDNQLNMALLENLKYTDLSGNFGCAVSASLDEQGVQTIYSGYLSLVSRDAFITVGKTQQVRRPVEGGTYTDREGTIWQIVSVIDRKLGYYWEITGRNFNVPGGLTSGTAALYHRDNTRTSTAGLSDPTWNQYASGPCLFMPDQQAANYGDEDAVTTMIAARVAMQGYQEMRAGDRFTLSALNWTVEGIEPFDPSFGAMAFRVMRRI